jgi:hypothetical protein
MTVAAWTYIPRRVQGVNAPGSAARRASAIGMVISGLLVAGATSALAQAPTAMVERAAKGASAQTIQVGLYLNVQADCTSGTLPALRLVDPPVNGTIRIKRGKVSATDYKQCLALEVPGFIAFYQSKPDFVGTDKVIIEVKYPQGRTELQRITINVGVGVGPGGQKI